MYNTYAPSPKMPLDRNLSGTPAPHQPPGGAVSFLELVRIYEYDMPIQCISVHMSLQRNIAATRGSGC